MHKSKMTVTTVLMAIALTGSHTYAQSGTCTAISTVPAVISSSGVYCVTATLTYTSIHAPAINVTQNGVVIDFNGFKLQWSGSVSSGNAAIKIDGLNVTIRNGLISGFETGIESYGDATIVEDMRLHNNDLGISIQEGAEGALIRRNYIRLGNGIEVYGTTLGETGNGSTRIIDNDIHGPDATTGFNGILIHARNAIVERNRLGRLASGIWFNPLTQATGKYRDNITTNVTIPYTGGTDTGNND